MPEPNYKAFLLRQSFCPVWKKNSCAQQEEKITACMTYSHQQSWDATFDKRKTAGNQRDIPALTDLRSGPLMQAFYTASCKTRGAHLGGGHLTGELPFSRERGDSICHPPIKSVCFPLISITTHAEPFLLVVGIGVDGAGYTCSFNFFLHRDNLLY